MKKKKKKKKKRIKKRKCSRCKVEKDGNEFSRSKFAKSGLRSACKLCDKEYQNRPAVRAKQEKKYMEYEKIPPVSRQKCIICSLTKPRKKFWADRRKKSRLKPQCIRCYKKYSKRYRDPGAIELRKQKNRARYTIPKIREYYLEKSKTYRLNPKNKRRQNMLTQKRYRDPLNTKRIRATRWIYTQKLKNNKLGLPYNELFFTREFYINLQNNTKWCASCNCDINYSFNRGINQADGPSIDRLNSNKGYTPENIRLVCRRCNELKTDCTDSNQLRVIADYMDREMMIMIKKKKKKKKEKEINN